MTDTPSQAEWLPGLREFTPYIVLDHEEFRFDEFMSALAGRKGVTIQKDRALVWVPDEVPWQNAMLTVFREEEFQVVEFRFRNSRIKRESEFTIGSIAELLEQCRSSAEPLFCTAVAEFERLVTEWTSTVPLNIPLPGMLSSTAGAPEVSGFDFSFRDPKYPLRRASISLQENVVVGSAYRLRLQYRSMVPTFAEVIPMMLSQASEHSQQFLTPLTHSTTPVADV